MNRLNKELIKRGYRKNSEIETCNVVGIENGFIIMLASCNYYEDLFILIDRSMKKCFVQQRYKDDIVFCGGNFWGVHTY